MTVPMILQFRMVPTGQGRSVYCYDGASTRDAIRVFYDGGDQNDAIRSFRISKHSIRRGDLDLCFLVPGRSGSSRSLVSYRFRVLIK